MNYPLLPVRRVLGALVMFYLLLVARSQGAEPMVLASGWQMQDAAKVTQSGAELSHAGFSSPGWYKATVPGTVLTTLVDNQVYAEPLYGENNRPDKIPDSLCRTDWWYRADFTVPAAYEGKKIWLNFDGINYAAEVWVNGTNVGTIKGAFIRGLFDISSLVASGKKASVAVRVSPQPHPGEPHEHTISKGMGKNGGITAIDGPTFLCAINWDWIPGIRDRDTGIWQKVWLSASGPVVVKDPLVTTDLPLPRIDTADVSIQADVQNVTDQPRQGVLKGRFGDVAFEQPVSLAPNSTQTVTLTPANCPQLHLTNPKLWWPNGFGPQNLYTLHLSFEMAGQVSDASDTSFGIRKITYEDPSSDNLIFVVNGVRVLAKGGDWGMDEAMKRIPRERLEAQIRMHQLANYTIIRNWVGQSTSADFYDLCDKYGILLWDEFFQPNPGDGPNPTDLDTYLANVRDKILRFRNHPSIAVWCARNEGYPPKNIDDALRVLMAKLDPVRHYQPSSTDGKGVHSGGPYSWRKPREFYNFSDGEAFKTEIGSVSIPTLESIQGMMPEKDWHIINDDWAEHDLASGAQGGNNYPSDLARRYGKPANIADFVRKAQLMNYEAFRAMYEGRQAKLFQPVTGVITWMSNPAQPSFVWQLYHYDLEPNSALFAVRNACEPVHIQLNEKLGNIQVINNRPEAFNNAKATLALYNFDGSVAYRHDFDVNAAGSAATDLGLVDWPANLTPIHFVKLELHDAAGGLVSDNFYWRARPPAVDDLTGLDRLPPATLTASVARRDVNGKCLLTVTLSNPGKGIALMAHLQLHRGAAGARVLPVYYTDNYVSLIPGEAKTITIEAALADLHGEKPVVLIDGWNIGVTPVTSPAADVALNINAQVDHWPATGLRIDYGPLQDEIHVNCGGPAVGIFQADNDYSGGNANVSAAKITATTATSDPDTIYQSERWGGFEYIFPMKSLPSGQGYTVRLHFAETKFAEPQKRMFNVSINGKKVLENFDVVKEAGGGNKAVVEEFTGIAPDGNGLIEVEFRKGQVDNPKVSAIEVVKP
ncbi:MAG TPA: malectin domain-containing carbohydrate-binding protein [Rariglobus sp.]|jgi:beta-mannosidase|nr:malectin domain-containing carbohydrate-binding protein [Rariglobus sp.]